MCGNRMNPQPPQDDDRIRWPRALSWAFYDFANTIYSAIVVSLAIALHVKEFTGVEKYTFLVTAVSMGLSGAVVPLAGEIADRTGRSKRWLLVLTVACCASCAAISAAPWAWLILAFYFVANFCYNTCFGFYDSLLPIVAPPRRTGLVSGIGVGLGYAGVAFAVPIAMLVSGAYAKTHAAHPLTPVFALAGLLFLLTSLPTFLLVPERTARPPVPTLRQSLGTAWHRTLATLRALPHHRDVFLFLIGNFLCVDALNATILGYAPYVHNVLGMKIEAVMFWMIPFALCALGWGVLGGRLTDRFGSRPVLIAAGVSFMLATLICGVASSRWAFFAAFLVLGGFGLATVWVAGRKMLLSLVPPGQVGKYFGLYNVGHKLSMIGTVLFGVLADVPIRGSIVNGYRAALLVQLFSMALGLCLIWKVKLRDATG